MIFKLNLPTNRALHALLTLSVGASLLALPAQAQNGFPPGGPNGGLAIPNNQNWQNQNWQTNPQQRSQMQSQMQNQMLQQTLQRFGLTDTNTLNAISTYANARMAARQPIQDGVRQVMQQMQQGQTTDAQAKDWMTNLQSALNTETVRSRNAERQLDAQIGFSRNAKLQLLLTMLGLIGDSDFLGNSGLGGRGMGGPGGMPGGPQGGMQGGFGGPQ